MADQPFPKTLWTRKTPDEARALYADWADSYDSDLAKGGYQTPARVAGALAATALARDANILDFGCGTGLSGDALLAEGFTQIDGTDISPEMLALAKDKALYANVIPGEPNQVPGPMGTYDAIVATGVVSLGAAPPETLTLLLDHLAPGGLLAFSYNEPTMQDAEYLGALDQVLEAGLAEELSRETGVHILEKNMTSTVFVLRRL